MKDYNKMVSKRQAVHYKFRSSVGLGSESSLAIQEIRIVDGREERQSIYISEQDIEQFVFMLQQALVELQIPDSDSMTSNLLQEPTLIETEQQAKTYCLAEVRKKFPRAYMPWDNEEDEELVHLYCKGTNVKAIATHLGRRRGAISSRIKKLGLKELYDVA